jgi:hypothetical protein
MQPKQPLVLLTTTEVDDAICRYALSKQGVDPDSVTSQSMCAYRIVDGKIFASVYFDQMAPVSPEERAAARASRGSP